MATATRPRTRLPIRLSEDLALPLDAVTETLGIFGQKGSGKSSTSAVFVEQGVGAGGRFVISDPTGVWWGLMHDGPLGSGLPGIVFGGEHADVPLEPTAGHIVAEFVVQQDEYPVVVLDMKLMRKADRTRFMLDFLETLYHENREALHVVLDESHQFAPTQAREGGDQIKLLGAVEDVVALGRARGLGITMISQRFATLNANVREQIGTLVAHRLVGSLDRKALKGWIEAQADPAREKEVMDVMAKLRVAQALVWSPAFLDFFGVVNVNAPTTFDSRATPKVGQRVKKPGKRAPVNLDVLRERMAATIEEAQANDPKLLKQRLFQAETKLTAVLRDNAARPTHEQAEEWQREIKRLTAALESRPPETVEVPVVTDEHLRELREYVLGIEAVQTGIDDLFEKLGQVLRPLAANVKDALHERDFPKTRPADPPRPSPTPRRQPEPPDQRPTPTVPRPAPEVAPDPGASGGASPLTNPEQRVLDALAWFEALNLSPVSRAQVGAIARYSHTSGGFKNLLSKLRSQRGLIDYPSDGMVALTAAGRALAQVAAIEPTAAAMQQAVLDRLSNPQARVLRVLLDAYPDTLTRAEIGERSGYEYTSGGFKNLLSALRSTYEVIEYPSQGTARASDWLFPL